MSLSRGYVKVDTSRQEQRQRKGGIVFGWQMRKCCDNAVAVVKPTKRALPLCLVFVGYTSFVFGRHFILRTDQKPFVKIFGEHVGLPSIVAAHLQRWALILSRYDYHNYSCGSSA